MSLKGTVTRFSTFFCSKDSIPGPHKNRLKTVSQTCSFLRRYSITKCYSAYKFDAKISVLPFAFGLDFEIVFTSQCPAHRGVRLARAGNPPPYFINYTDVNKKNINPLTNYLQSYDFRLSVL